ncbi:MAG: YiiX/YebB-like N1pC/P60 family cysteine hydrolase [Proteobacteria bacterium]|nr:YiiX/YebB-like N1pC/P60 family cysteine hydrolase [Pseudomonadota bacterium]
MNATLQNADIIFQTSSSNQSNAIMWASKSLYSHVGLIEKSGDKTYVIEAISKVSRTPIEIWIARGRLDRYAVYRHENLSPAAQSEIMAAAKSLLGRKYDILFTSDNLEIYCSELVAIAYQKSNIALGSFQKVSELDVDNFLVKKLVRARWKKHPVCKHSKTFEDCWPKILEDKLITPIGLTTDQKLKLFFSNYP